MIKIFKNINFNKIYYWIILAISFFMPLNLRVDAIAIGILAAIWILESKFSLRLQNILNNRLSLLFVSYYIIYIIGLFYTKNLTFGIFDMEIKLSLMIFPIIFASLGIDFFTKRVVTNICIVFVLGCFVATIECIWNAVNIYLQTKSTEVFFYKDLSVILHPTYFSMYIDLAICIIAYILLKDFSRITTLNKILYIALLIYLNVFVILLSSKAGILFLVPVYILIIFYIFYYLRRYLLAIGISSMIVLSFLLLFKIFPLSIKRIHVAKEAVVKKEGKENIDEGTADRLKIWKTSIDLIKETPLTGYGTGDIKDVLLERYRQSNMISAYDKKLNAHNQYLQTWIATGISGFIILCLCLFMPLVISLRENMHLYFIFLILIILNLFVESIFERQAGVVFYSFFNSILYLYRCKNNNSDVLKV